VFILQLIPRVTAFYSIKFKQTRIVIRQNVINVSEMHKIKTQKS